MNYEKYKRFETIKLKDRTWPDKTIEKAPKEHAKGRTKI